MTCGNDLEEAIRSVAVELGVSRDKMLKVIVREWLEQNAYLPVRELEEDGVTVGADELERMKRGDVKTQ